MQGLHADRVKQHEVRLLDGTFTITVSVQPYSMFRNVSSVATKLNPCNTTKNWNITFTTSTTCVHMLARIVFLSKIPNKNIDKM